MVFIIIDIRDFFSYFKNKNFQFTDYEVTILGEEGNIYRKQANSTHHSKYTTKSILNILDQNLEIVWHSTNAFEREYRSNQT